MDATAIESVDGRQGSASLASVQRKSIELDGHASLLGDFHEGDVARFPLFVECAKRLQACAFLDMMSNVTLAWDTEHGFRNDGLDEDRLAAGIHRLRPFLHQDERAHFPWMLKRLRAAFGWDTEFAALADDAHRTFNGSAFRGAVTVSIARPDSSGGMLTEILNSDDWLKRWLYGFEWHTDEDHRATLRELLGEVSFDVAVWPFANLLAQKAIATIRVASWVHCLRDRP